MYHAFRVFGELTKTFKISSALYEENQIWCTMFYDPYLYKIDLETKEISTVTRILTANEEIDSYMLILLHRDYFVFIQSTTNKFIIMNRKTFDKEIYDIPAASKKSSRLSQKFANGIIQDDNLYIFGSNYKGIVKFNLLNKDFYIIDSFISELKITNHNENICLYDYIKVDNRLYFPLMNSNCVLEFSLDENTIDIHYVGDEKQRYVSGAWDGENLWLAPRDGRIGDIVKWNHKSNSVKQYTNPLSKDESAPVFMFDKMFCMKDKIIILSSRGIHNNLEINLDTEDIMPFNDICDDRIYLGSKYSCTYLQEQTLFYIEDFNLVKYDFKSKKVEKLPLKPNADVANRIDKTEADKLKFIFSSLKNSNSTVYVEQVKLNLHHLIKSLIS